MATLLTYLLGAILGLAAFDNGPDPFEHDMGLWRAIFWPGVLVCACWKAPPEPIPGATARYRTEVKLRGR
jgi:hypothetical protein